MQAIRRNYLSAVELKKSEGIGGGRGVRRKCCFRFSKALLSTAQPPH